MICMMPAVAMPEVGAAVKTGKLSYRNDTIKVFLFAANKKLRQK